jgi:SulP family sulfate permease
MNTEPAIRAWTFRPKLLESLRDYSGEKFRQDLVAGVTVGIVALPLALAFGISSGVTPAAGLYTAIVAGFLISALGGSRVQIGGPTGAFVGVVYGIVMQFGVNGLVIATLLAGVILIFMSLARLGGMIRFIPYPVTTGFTAGIAVIIFSTQLKDFLGLQIEKVPAEFVPKMGALVTHLNAVHWPTFGLALGCFCLTRFWPRGFQRYAPGSVAAMVAGTVVAALFLPGVETIASRFGDLPRSLPAPQFPDLADVNWRALMPHAFTITMLAAIESLLSAVVADGMIEDRHDPNTELFGQGVANIASALFGGFCATGAIARTATNVKSGARSPIAGMIHAVTLLVIILAAAPLAKFIPLSVLAAVLVNVSLNMGEWQNLFRLRRWPKSDAGVYVIVFLLTVLVDLTAAVEVGVVLAAFLFIKRISETTQITAVDDRQLDLAPQDSLLGKDIPHGVVAYQMFGAFLFGTADKLEAALQRFQREPKVLIIGMKRVMAMDATGLNALEELHAKMRRRGKWLLLAGPHTQPLLMMQKDGFVERMGTENFCENMDAALTRARSLLAQKPGGEASPAPPSSVLTER